MASHLEKTFDSLRFTAATACTARITCWRVDLYRALSP